MPEDYRKKLFDEYLETSYKHGNILTTKQFQMASEAYTIDYQGIMPEDTEAVILDFGCGTGDFLYHLKQKGYKNFYGVDISPQQVEYCRQHITDRVEKVNGMDFLKGKQGVYDLIAAHDVLEHIPKEQTLEFLHLSKEALKKNGTLIIRVPNMSNPFGLDARYNDMTHEIGFTSKSLNQALEISGFKDIRILSPREIPVRSFPNLVRKILVKILHAALRFCFYIQDYTVPKNLDKNLVAAAKKG
jgi:2-polyprenyl-3-methyl-5-hydroxy-6-metoxy-1,4-benzoquinol methylase